MTRLDFSRLSARKKHKGLSEDDNARASAAPSAVAAPRPHHIESIPSESRRVLETVTKSEAETQRLLKQTPGFRRSFGASFGAAGQLVIPRPDGTIQFILEPSGNVPAAVLERELQVYRETPAVRNPRFADARVEGYSKATDKWKQPRRDVVFRLLASVAGPAHPSLTRERDLVRDRVVAVQNGRREQLDDWVRCCLGRLGISGLQVGDTLSECHRALNDGTVEDLRAATILSQAPNLGPFAFSQLEGAKAPRAIAKLVDAVRGKRPSDGRKEAWISDLGASLWYSKRALDPLVSVLDDVQMRQGYRPSDGCFALLEFIAEPSSPAFARALMNLRDSNSDWSLAFHVGRLFLDAGVAVLSPRKTALLYMQFAHQLERAGLWQWALYLVVIAPHLIEIQRKRAVYELLCRHLDERDSHKRKFVRAVCRVSEPYLSYALAIQHLYFHRRDQDGILDRFAESGEIHECLHLFCSYQGPRLLLSERLGEFKAQVEALGLTRERANTFWHLGVAWQWLYLQMGFVYLRSALDELSSRQRTVGDFLSVFNDFVDSLSSYSRTAFPRLAYARPLIYVMGDWMASTASLLISNGTATLAEVDLVKILQLSVSPDTRRLVLIKHSPSDKR